MFVVGNYAKSSIEKRILILLCGIKAASAENKEGSA